MRSITGLDSEEAADVAEKFGVSFEQVRRDHLISLVLASLQPLADGLIFFGGTALARTYLADGTLSEDVDLIATVHRTETAHRVMRLINRGLLPTHGRLRWSRPLNEVREVDPVTVSTEAGINLRIQLLSAQGYSPWPVQSTDLAQRYSDAPSARLVVPTRDGFVAWKTAAWMDRAAPRDLYDLWALANVGALTSSAARLFAQHGPINTRPQTWMFDSAPTELVWRDQLAGQTRLTVSALDALRVVREGWSRVVD